MSTQFLYIECDQCKAPCPLYYTDGFHTAEDIDRIFRESGRSGQLLVWCPNGHRNSFRFSGNLILLSSDKELMDVSGTEKL